MAIVDFDYESQEAGNKRPPASPHSAGEVYCESGKASIDATYVNADMIGLVKLPKGCVPIDCILKSDQLDGASSVSAAVTCAVGIANATHADLVASTSMIAASTVPQAGGIQYMNSNKVKNIKAKNVDRIIAMKITHAPGTGVSSASGATAGAVRLDLRYRSAGVDDWSASLS